MLRKKRVNNGKYELKLTKRCIEREREIETDRDRDKNRHRHKDRDRDRDRERDIIYYVLK